MKKIFKCVTFHHFFSVLPRLYPPVIQPCVTHDVIMMDELLLHHHRCAFPLQRGQLENDIDCNTLGKTICCVSQEKNNPHLVIPHL